MVQQLTVAAIALGAAFCFAASNVIEQRRAALAPPETALKIAILWFLARQPVWWLGIAVDVGGFGLQVLALGLGPVVFVQPVLVTSLLFALVLAAATGSLQLSWRDLGWAVVFMASLSVFLIAADPSGGVDTRSIGAWSLALIVIGGAVLVAVAVSRRLQGGWRAAALAGAAGMAFGVSSTLMKGFASELDHDGVMGMLGHWEPYAMGLVLAGGFLLLQSAFQASDLRAALPLLEVGEPVIACILGLALLSERLHAANAPAKAVIVVAVALMALSALVLARSAARAHGGKDEPEPVVDLRADDANPTKSSVSAEQVRGDQAGGIS